MPRRSGRSHILILNYSAAAARLQLQKTMTKYLNLLPGEPSRAARFFVAWRAAQKIGGELRYQIKLRNAGAARAAASNPSTPPLPSADGASLEVASLPQQSSDSASESDAGPRDMDSEEEILAHGERESNDSGGVFLNTRDDAASRGNPAGSLESFSEIGQGISAAIGTLSLGAELTAIPDDAVRRN